MKVVSGGKEREITCHLCKSKNMKLGKTTGGGVKDGMCLWDFTIYCNDCGFEENMQLDQYVEELIDYR